MIPWYIPILHGTSPPTAMFQGYCHSSAGEAWKPTRRLGAASCANQLADWWRKNHSKMEISALKHVRFNGYIMIYPANNGIIRVAPWPHLATQICLRFFGVEFRMARSRGYKNGAGIMLLVGNCRRIFMGTLNDGFGYWVPGAGHPFQSFHTQNQGPNKVEHENLGDVWMWQKWTDRASGVHFIATSLYTCRKYAATLKQLQRNAPRNSKHF